MPNTSTRIILKKPKTDSSIRKVWLPKTLAYILREWKKSQDELKGFLGDEYQDFDLVVALPNGRPCEDRIILKEFAKLREDAGLPKVVFHSLRHSSTTYKLKLNHGDLKATQGDTGHAEIDMITSIYAHILDEDRKVNVSKLLGKQTIDTNTYGQSKGRSGSYTTNFQTVGRELMTPDEVRMLDNRYALLFIRGERPVKDLKYNILKHPNVALTTDGQAAAYQHGTDPLSVAAVSINLEKLKQAVPENTDTGDYVILTEEEVYDFMRKKAQENNQNQNSNYQEVTYEKHHPQHHSSHPSYF